MKNILLLFKTTRTVIKAEALCRSNKIEIQVVTVPREVSSECGMALSISADEVEKVKNLLLENNIDATVYDKSSTETDFDLLTTVENGGCSAKLPMGTLRKAIKGLEITQDSNLLVGINTCDDAGVYKLTDEIALIETTDFFPPICSNAFEFGQIAAANALSDVFAMGGTAKTAMNLVMFPATGIDFKVLEQILAGGKNKVDEAGASIVGGHSIADYPPKYGLAVTGTVHPQRIISNNKASPDQAVILTKPLGTGVLVAAQKLGLANDRAYKAALESMKQLNKAGSEIMQKYNVNAATDITGFGLLGHALNVATSSKVHIEFYASEIPALQDVADLLATGCIPGAALKNMDAVNNQVSFSSEISQETKLLLCDPQTSGGLLIFVKQDLAKNMINELKQAGYKSSKIIGLTSTQKDDLSEMISVI